MLGDDLAGRPYVKSRHSAALMARIGRSHRSVEFKHQNISAVLDELGLPWIPGYKPKSNYQNAIFDAIDRYLTAHRDVLETAPTLVPVEASPSEVFVLPPIIETADREVPVRLRRLVSKFDPVQRDYRNRVLGKAGEAFVVDLEARRLHAESRSDLARRVRWVADEDGDGAGFDVLSFRSDGLERFIEVKTTNGTARTPFFLSRNEKHFAEENPSSWELYRVHLFARTPRVFVIQSPLEGSLILSPETWRASF